MTRLGLFDSTARPGMRSNFGSLSGSSLGDMSAVAMETGAAMTPATTPTPPAGSTVAGISTTTIMVVGGAVAVAVWWKFFRKK